VGVLGGIAGGVRGLDFLQVVFEGRGVSHRLTFPLVE
jgi:hypothetical protein